MRRAAGRRNLIPARRHASRRGHAGMAGLAAGLAITGAAAASLGLVPPAAGTAAVAGLPVPAGQLQAVKTAAMSCPELTGPRLAAQLMAASRFNPHATGPGGRSGVAGLTAAQWQEWDPAPGTPRSDVTANITALAHDMCNLAGLARAAGVPGNTWSLALAAFHSGLAAVTAAHRIPAAAASYVTTVTSYAAWYAQQPQFGGHGTPPATATPAPTTPAPAATPSATPTAAGAGTTATPAAGPAFGWQLTWSDEFNGTAGSPPDPAKWSHDTGGSGWGNSELEDYTDSTANAALSGTGQLAITARTTGTAGQTCWYGPCRYTSARLVTAGHFAQAYGQISARIKLPSGQGIWPSFWALGSNFPTVGWPQSGQIDIMTTHGASPATVSAGLIGPGLQTWSADTLAPGALSAGYHTFTADWYPDHVSFLVDGHLYATQYAAAAGAGWVFNHPFFLILNLAVGGTVPGSPGPATTFPQQMLVDWVRVYKPAPPATPATGSITSPARPVPRPPPAAASSSPPAPAPPRKPGPSPPTAPYAPRVSA